MVQLKRYTRRDKTTVVAIKIALEMEGFTYRKWGNEQIARAGDWLIQNDGDVYTVASDVFDATYAHVRDGVYAKTSCVWAMPAQSSGRVKSTSGFTDYRKGDMIVFSDARKIDGWAMSRERFMQLYQMDE